MWLGKNDQEQPIINRVDRGGIADVHKLIPHDRLLAINGKATAKMLLPAVAACLGQSGPVAVTIGRDNKSPVSEQVRVEPRAKPKDVQAQRPAVAAATPIAKLTDDEWRDSSHRARLMARAKLELGLLQAAGKRPTWTSLKHKLAREVGLASVERGRDDITPLLYAGCLAVDVAAAATVIATEGPGVYAI